MLVWTCPTTHRTMVGPVAPEGVPAAGVDEDADPNRVWWNPKTGDAAEVPPAPSPCHLFDPVAGKWVDPISPEERAEIAQGERDRLLALTNAQMMPDYEGDRAPWIAYRQALRDMTFGAGDVEWPEPPAE